MEQETFELKLKIFTEYCLYWRRFKSVEVLALLKVEISVEMSHLFISKAI